MPDGTTSKVVYKEVHTPELVNATTWKPPNASTDEENEFKIKQRYRERRKITRQIQKEKAALESVASSSMDSNPDSEPEFQDQHSPKIATRTNPMRESRRNTDIGIVTRFSDLQLAENMDLWGDKKKKTKKPKSKN